jgi:hypothetical protein
MLSNSKLLIMNQHYLPCLHFPTRVTYALKPTTLAIAINQIFPDAQAFVRAALLKCAAAFVLTVILYLQSIIRDWLSFAR